MTETGYVVQCDHCDLRRSYPSERIARGHKLSHWSDRRHAAKITEEA